MTERAKHKFPPSSARFTNDRAHKFQPSISMSFNNVCPFSFCFKARQFPFLRPPSSTSHRKSFFFIPFDSWKKLVHATRSTWNTSQARKSRTMSCLCNHHSLAARSSDCDSIFLCPIFMINGRPHFLCATMANCLAYRMLTSFSALGQAKGLHSTKIWLWIKNEIHGRSINNF